jgi:hypothetical protein
MKNRILTVLTILAGITIIVSCGKSFLEQKPLGALDENVLANKAGVEGLLIGAYSLLDGYGAGGNWDASGSNWVYGGVVGGDAHKGSDAGDQGDIVPMEQYKVTATNGYFNNKWRTVYEGVARCNNTLNILAKATDISAVDVKRITAEARFLRAHYHFEAKKMWNNVPYVDEKNTTLKPTNTTDIWPNIEADFQFAYDNLPELQDKIGRANKWSAGAFLAKVKMFRKDFAGAKTILANVITNGKTSLGTKYALNARFDASFDADTKNSPEAVFSVQYSVNDGANGDNGGWGDVLNFPYTGGPGGCCGFYQPTQDLVNSFQVDAVTGLPISVDNNYPTGGYNVIRVVKSDDGLNSTDPFTPETGTLDPRLDWTVGRRGIPYRDYGPHPGQQWIRDQAYSGPYAPIKNTYKKSQEGVLTDKSFWTSGVTANNYTLIRFADVILWAAEAEVEAGTLAQALVYVNMIRQRASNPAGFVKKADGSNAANYKIGLYPAIADQATGRKIVKFERKLELAMEGHRFFDLARWGDTQTTLQAYVNYESTLRAFLKGVTVKTTSNYFPIPQAQIDQSSVGGKATLTQNPGY